MELFFACFVCFLGLWTPAVLAMGAKMDGNMEGGSISFETPTLDDEDTYSPFMPADLKCDACRIIAAKFNERFDKEHKNRKSLKKGGSLPESDVIDIVDQICTDPFENVGVKEINGVRRMSAPGFETADAPGVMQGGGRWPGRMREMCSAYVGELGEDELYDRWKKKSDIENYLCYGKGIRGYCKIKTKKVVPKKKEEDDRPQKKDQDSKTRAKESENLKREAENKMAAAKNKKNAEKEKQKEEKTIHTNQADTKDEL
ncbi:marginal zone B- and B1-cell-specific protein [Lingula anatina]|uniref:Marginal zone B- and B1-cell-specific protein n=1 Tax=Lingula anatina TaxID=7574 RepID=A0A1S3KFQ9_LINAN|nr:marginal zone B- and B1-cell-specific protein [Lingula anatina]|eukprot:XP_013421294.1 marginal zone B- and B1-cell-specific protein [Lingula anatina]